MSNDDAVVAWLAGEATDVALRWQVERYLVGVAEPIWRRTRASVAVEGFGARLLEYQDPDGQWGLDAAVLGDTAERLRVGCRWECDDLPYWGGETDACINGMTLANGSWLGVDMSGLATWFVDHAAAEGGWNCEWVNGSTRSSFPSTLSALDGILDHEIRTGGSTGLTTARHAAEEYLLERRLLYRLSTGEQVAWWADRFAYPFRSYYSALRALDYFRRAAEHDGRAPDPRLGDAVELVRTARAADGTWLQQRRHPGRVWFEVDVAAGEPSRWLTFHALRVLCWWDSAPVTGGRTHADVQIVCWRRGVHLEGDLDEADSR